MIRGGNRVAHKVRAAGNGEVDEDSGRRTSRQGGRGTSSLSPGGGSNSYLLITKQVLCR